MAELLYRLGRFSARRAWVVIGSWIGIMAVAVAGFLVGFGTLTSSFDVPNTPSSEVVEELSDKLPDFAGASGTVVFHTEDGSALTEDQQEEISAVIADADGLPEVTDVLDPFATEAERADGAQELADGQDQISTARTQLDEGQTQLDAGRDALAAGQQQLDAGRAQLEAAGLPTADLDAQQALLDGQAAELEAQQSALDEGRAELEASAAEADLGQELLSYADGIRMVSEDGDAALANIQFSVPRMELSQEAKDAVIEHFSAADIDGVAVDFSTDIAQGIPQILGVGEVVGVVIAAVVLLVMLGSVIAASFPIVTALVGVAVGALSTLAFSGVIQMASVTPILGVMLGLAVGIDYSLFIVNRHRRQLLQGADVHESVGLANGTAGNAVVFAGSTVIVALFALNITGVPFLGLMGTVGAIGVIIAVLIAITLTPALLGLAGERILSRKMRARAAEARAVWAADAAHTAQADAVAEAEPAAPASAPAPAPTKRAIVPMPTWRAIITTVVAVAALLVMALPAMSMRLGLPDGASEPADSTSYAAFTVVEDRFGAGVNGPILIAATLPDAVADEDLVETQVAVASELAALDDVVAVAPIGVSDDATLLAFQVVPAEGPNSLSTDQLVRELRELGPLDGDITLGVAGQAAINIEISESLQNILPLYLAVVVGLSLLIMIIVFRSFLVPLIATGGFVLSLLATFGAVVAVFQWGWGADLLGLATPGPILSFLPVLLIGILFGLAMDYQLFLATGMREAFVHGSPARLAVAQGFHAGRSVVIAAGLIMVAVFGGFVFSHSVMIQVMGFGLAVGVLLDAFVVRLLLMPALMHLLGRSAWWFPRWLDRIVPNVDVEGAALERRHHLH